MTRKPLLSDEEFYRTLPKKAIGAAVMFFNDLGHVLVVKPNYKDGWSLPGGSVDGFESPRKAAIREIQEEIGLAIEEPPLLCVDYRTALDRGEESIQFIFHGGVLSAERIEAIVLQEDELDAFKFVDPAGDISELRTGLRRRLPQCIEAIRSSTTIYLED